LGGLGWGGSGVGVDAKPKLDPELAEVVGHARRRASAMAEWPNATMRPFEATIPAEAAPAVTAWLLDGGCDEGVAHVSSEDPGLATQ